MSFPIRFVLFHNVRIPRENLLNKTGDVTPDGCYVTPFKVKIFSGNKSVYSSDVSGQARRFKFYFYSIDYVPGVDL